MARLLAARSNHWVLASSACAKAAIARFRSPPAAAIIEDFSALGRQIQSAAIGQIGLIPITAKVGGGAARAPRPPAGARDCGRRSEGGRRPAKVADMDGGDAGPLEVQRLLRVERG